MTDPSLGMVSPTYPPPGQQTIDVPSGFAGRYTPIIGVMMLRVLVGHSGGLAGSMDSPPGAWPGQSGMICWGGVSGGTGMKLAPPRPPRPAPGADPPGTGALPGVAAGPGACANAEAARALPPATMN